MRVIARARWGSLWYCPPSLSRAGRKRRRRRMNARDRVLAAMEGFAPDRVPCALGFYHMEFEQLALDTAHPDDRVDIHFVRFPLSSEEKALQQMAEPYSPDTRLGTPAQVATYARWGYQPQNTEYGSPLAGAKSLD